MDINQGLVVFMGPKQASRLFPCCHSVIHGQLLHQLPVAALGILCVRFNGPMLCKICFICVFLTISVSSLPAMIKVYHFPLLLAPHRKCVLKVLEISPL